MPTRREDTLWSVVHQRSMHLRALLDSLDVDIDVGIRYELDYYPYVVIELLRVRDGAPPLVLRSVYVQANRQWEYHSEFLLRVIGAALRLVEEYRADPSLSGAGAVWA
jgi:hypothetical protein